MEKSFLDSELLAITARIKAGYLNAAPISLDKLGPQMRSAGVNTQSELPAQESSKITLKLIVAPESAEATVGWINENGGEVVSSGPSVLIANLDVSVLPRIEQMSGIRRAEASRRLEYRMQDARGDLTGTDAGILTHALTGDGVVVGVIDSGVDWSHPDFRHSNGTSRIEMFIKADRPTGASTSTYSEFDSNDIDTAISGGAPIPAGDSNGHGTHCAGIAAGNGLQSDGQHRGIATGATLMTMSSSLFDDEIITGIRRIFNAAGNRPAVINLSLGGHWGAHDGTSAIENVIADETGPGRIIVVAAGNEGTDRIHWSGQLDAGQTLTVNTRIDDQEFQFVDIWIPRGDDVNLRLEAAPGEAVDIDGLYHQTSIGMVGGVARVDPINGDQNVTLFLGNCVTDSAVLLHIDAITISQGTVHAWSGPAVRNVFQGESNTHCVGMPATEEQAISVASFVSRTNTRVGDPPTPGLTVGGLSPFSSRGPTRTGNQKPDVAAPGQFITSTLATNSTYATDTRYSRFRDPSGDYISIQGTSMATPFVAGVIALMLEREPLLNPAEIRQRLRATSTRNATTGQIWNGNFGVGRIDVETLLNYGA